MTAKTTRKPTRSAAKTAKRSRPATKASRKPKPDPTPQGTKQSQLIEMLRSPAGATIEQLTHLTGWQPHSVRGVISGALRKRLKFNVDMASLCQEAARVPLQIQM